MIDPKLSLNIANISQKYTPAMSHDAAKVLPKLNVGRNLLLHAQIY